MADITRYVNLNLPIPLAKEVDKIIGNPINGYRSRNEFCMEAIRTKIREYNSGGVDDKGKKA